jgi:hypothetical protein
MSEVAGFVAWLGGAVIVLADGRRGLAVGLGLLAMAAAGVTWAGGEQGGAILLLGGGVLGGALRFTIGPEGWGLMQPGSTPRLLLAVVMGIVALWLALVVTSGAGGGSRFAIIAALLLLGGRVLQDGSQAVMLTAIAGFALVLGAVAQDGIASYALASLITAGVSAMPVTSPVAPRGT